MKSFEQWFQESPLAPPKTGSWQHWEDQGYGSLQSDRKFMITCRSCGRDFPISDFIDPDEFEPDIRETWMCGRNERCCP